MPNYIHKFNNVADFNTAYNGNNYLEPWTSLTKNGIVESFTITALKGTTDAEEWETYDPPIAFVFAKKIRHDENGNVMYLYEYTTGDGDPIFIKTLNFGAGDTISFFYDLFEDGYSIGEGLAQISNVVIKDKVDYNKKQDPNNWIEIIPDGFSETYDVPMFSVFSVGSNFNNTVGESNYSFPYDIPIYFYSKGQPLDFCREDVGIVQIDPNSYNYGFYKIVNENNIWQIIYVARGIN